MNEVALEEIKYFDVNDVFTPSSPAIASFVSRKENITSKLINALKTRGKQIVIFGHSGTGKTTFLVNILNQIYEGHITTRCMKTLTFDQLLLDAFSKLDPFYIAERQCANKTNAEIKADATFSCIKLALAANQQRETSYKEVRLVPPQLTAENLAVMLGAKKLCWVLEDFHKIPGTEKSKLSQTMKIFMDCAAQYPEAKIIALGATQTARQVVEYDPEMENRVAEIEVSLMDKAEVKKIIEKGEERLNIRFSENAKELISDFSQGVPSACHQLCLNACNAHGITGTKETEELIGDTDIQAALKSYVEEASDTLKARFEKALKPKSANAVLNYSSEIIKIMSLASGSGLDRFSITKKIKENHSVNSDITIKKTLEKLTKPEMGEILRFNSNSQIYFFSEPIYHVYANTIFRAEEATKRKSPSIDVAAMGTDELLSALMTELTQRFKRQETRRLEQPSRTGRV